LVDRTALEQLSKADQIALLLAQEARHAAEIAAMSRRDTRCDHRPLSIVLLRVRRTADRGDGHWSCRTAGARSVRAAPAWIILCAAEGKSNNASAKELTTSRLMVVGLAAALCRRRRKPRQAQLFR
jgi:hypothetical protein